MTTRTRYTVVCPCGHKGTIKMSENDQPYSKSYESYSLVDLNGSEFSIEGFAEWPKVFAEMKPKCPKCGTLLTQEHLA